MLRSVGFALVLALALAAPAYARDASAPPTRVGNVVDTYHGQAVQDPYRWLEGDDAEVRAFDEAQTARTRAYLDALPGRAAIRTRMQDYLSQSSATRYMLTAAGERLFCIYAEPGKQQAMLAVMGRDADPARQRVVVDPNKIDPTGATSIDWYIPSPDGRYVAVSLSRAGSELGTLSVFDVRTGQRVHEQIPRVNGPTAGGDVAWSPDGRGFWYTRYPGEERPEADRAFYQQVYFHRFGDDPAQDAHVFGDGLPRIAEIKLDFSREANALLISVQNGDGGDFAHYVRSRDGHITQVTRFEDDIDFAVFGPDRALYLVGERAAPRRYIQRLAPGMTDLAQARTIVEQGEDVIVTDFWGEDPINFAAGRMYVRYIAGGPSRVRIFDLAGRPQGDLDLPEIAAVNEIEPVGADVLYSVETYLTPLQFYRRHNGAGTPTALRVTSPIRFDDAEVVRAFATSRDGTRVPVNIIRRRGAAQDGSAPAILYGYGGYGLSQTPFFLGGPRRMWLDSGGVFAIANIRGGGEYGEDWHQQGALTHKQNVFDDFIAAADYLARERYTSPQHLALRGGSNGGLLMGAVLTQRPDIARAIVSDVGIYDMIRSEFEPNGEFNVTEFGTIRDPAQFSALYAYSPYHHVRTGTNYPAVLLTTGLNDGRVAPFQSRKMAAALQAATASGLPIYLRVRSDSGHGMGSALSAMIDDSADYQAFIYDQLGVPPPSAAAPVGQR
ncbi:prolyl oligopeptidase family protein [Terricaulis sp.]|uniref:prolyl oligopeptidase family protein n=1 Tax=Terricaulis sp. TaxID=2768686 RepID=UPI0037850447